MAEEVVVIEKVIVKEPLTKEMIDAGANVLHHLNKANFDVQAALWIYRLESNSWRLVFALPEVEKDGPLKSYTKIRRILSQIPDNYNGPQYSGQELSKKYGLTVPYKWRIEDVNQTDSTHCEVQVYCCP